MTKHDFSEEDTEAMKAVSDADTDNFVELLRIAGLDPYRDLTCANLTGVDFSNCDVRGFDFTNSDLTGSTGINVIWDETTIFTGATVAGSVFERRLQ